MSNATDPEITEFLAKLNKKSQTVININCPGSDVAKLNESLQSLENVILAVQSQQKMIDEVYRWAQALTEDNRKLANENNELWARVNNHNYQLKELDQRVAVLEAKFTPTFDE